MNYEDVSGEKVFFEGYRYRCAPVAGIKYGRKGSPQSYQTLIKQLGTYWDFDVYVLVKDTEDNTSILGKLKSGEKSKLRGTIVRLSGSYGVGGGTLNRKPWPSHQEIEVYVLVE